MNKTVDRFKANRLLRKKKHVVEIKQKRLFFFSEIKLRFISLWLSDLSTFPMISSIETCFFPHFPLFLITYTQNKERKKWLKIQMLSFHLHNNDLPTIQYWNCIRFSRFPLVIPKNINDSFLMCVFVCLCKLIYTAYFNQHKMCLSKKKKKIDVQMMCGFARFSCCLRKMWINLLCFTNVWVF